MDFKCWSNADRSLNFQGPRFILYRQDEPDRYYFDRDRSSTAIHVNISNNGKRCPLERDGRFVADHHERSMGFRPGSPTSAISISSRPDWSDQEKHDYGSTAASPEQFVQMMARSPTTAIRSFNKVDGPVFSFAGESTPVFVNSEEFANEVVKNDPAYML
jgi:hypothetical protein